VEDTPRSRSLRRSSARGDLALAAIMRLARDRLVRRQQALWRPFPQNRGDRASTCGRHVMSQEAPLQGLRVESGGGGIRTLDTPLRRVTVFEIFARSLRPLSDPERRAQAFSARTFLRSCSHAKGVARRTSPRLLLVVQTRRATGGELGARIVYLSGSGDWCPVWASLSGPGKRVGVGQRGEHPVRRGADADGGVSPTHRGRARSARRSPVSRTSWSRPGRAGRLR
jgi:hypothetical protein